MPEQKNVSESCETFVVRYSYPAVLPSHSFTLPHGPSPQEKYTCVNWCMNLDLCSYYGVAFRVVIYSRPKAFFLNVSYIMKVFLLITSVLG